jgi:type I restriction enzyme S subunit
MSRQPYPKYRPSGVAWLGEIPEHWEVRRLKTVARFGYGDSLAADDRVVGPYKVYGSNGVVDQHDRANTQSPCLIIGRKGSFGKVAFSDKPCFAIDTTYFVDSRLTAANLRWLYYSLQWLRLDSISKDSAVPGLSREDAYENRLVFCPSDEQRAIAAFLDRETGRIDALIEKKQRQIELLQEKRSALISHAVTKGLDPNVKMKDSGIEWLGEIPEHWEAVPLRWFVQIGSGSFLSNSEFVTEATDDSPIPVIGGNGVMGYTNRSNVQSPTLAIGRVGVYCGNVHVIAPPAWVTDNALVLSQIRGFRLRYLAHVLAMANLNRLAKQNTQPLVTGTMVKEQTLPLPSESEQDHIVRCIDVESRRMDALAGWVQSSIALLREYRTALISAAVTGKIDVRKEVA